MMTPLFEAWRYMIYRTLILQEADTVIERVFSLGPLCWPQPCNPHWRPEVFLHTATRTLHNHRAVLKHQSSRIR
jgi:hypothetical protein